MEQEYLRWLIAFIDPRGLVVDDRCFKMLEELYSTDFRIKRGFEDDKNRSADGVYLRVYFAEDHGVYSEMRDPDRNGIYADIDAWIGIEGKPCSCLEVLVALAKRIEHDFYGDDLSVSEFFWYFIANLGITEEDDEVIVSRKLRKWLNREYEPNGKGGIFKTNQVEIDMREYSIWAQLNIVLIENDGVLW